LVVETHHSNNKTNENMKKLYLLFTLIVFLILQRRILVHQNKFMNHLLVKERWKNQRTGIYFSVKEMGKYI
jgi:hypothetical protein